MLIKSVLMDNNEGLYIDLSDIQARLKRLESSSSSVTDYPVKVKSPVQLGETKTFYAWKLSVIGETEVTLKVPEYNIGGIYKGKYLDYDKGDAIPVYEGVGGKIQVGSGTHTYTDPYGKEQEEHVTISATTTSIASNTKVYQATSEVGLGFSGDLPKVTSHYYNEGTDNALLDAEFTYATNETHVTEVDDTPYYNIKGNSTLHKFTTPKEFKDAVLTFEEEADSTDTIYKKIPISDIVFYTTELPDLTVVQDSVDSSFPLKSIEVIKDSSWETTSITYRSNKSTINELIYTNIPFNTSYTLQCTSATIGTNAFKGWASVDSYYVNGYGFTYGELKSSYIGSGTSAGPKACLAVDKLLVALVAIGDDSNIEYGVKAVNDMVLHATEYIDPYYYIDKLVSTDLAWKMVDSSAYLVSNQTFVSSFEAYQEKYVATEKENATTYGTAYNYDGGVYYKDYDDAPTPSALYTAAESMANKSLAYYASTNFLPENLAYKKTGFSSVDTVSSSLNGRIAKTYFPLFMKNDAGVMKMLADVEYDVKSIKEAPYYKIIEARYNPTLKGNNGLCIQISSDVKIYSSYPTGFVDFAKFAEIKDTLVRTKFLNALGISSFVDSSISLERVPSLDTTTSCEGLIIIQQDADTYHSNYNGTEKVYYAPSAGTEDTMNAVVNAERSSVVS